MPRGTPPGKLNFGLHSRSRRRITWTIESRTLAARYLDQEEVKRLEEADPLAQNLLTALADAATERFSLTHLNQLLHLNHLPGVSDGFFAYYFLTHPKDLQHPYNLASVLGGDTPDLFPDIQNLEQFEWGVKRFLIDSLLFFGDVSTAYSNLAKRSFDDLRLFFAARAYDADRMKKRGRFVGMQSIPIDDRYLIAELACKGYDVVTPGARPFVAEQLVAAYASLPAETRKGATIRRLLEANKAGDQEQLVLTFSVEEILDEPVASEHELLEKLSKIGERFNAARHKALLNTDVYLSVINDLDVYVATSMRNRQDFRDMATFCKRLFEDSALKSYNIRYFDPTRSACAGHEDKGLIECLMVKCAKVLVYFAGEKDSFGKDSEAAMALSQGKPVIIVCPDTEKGKERVRFFRDVHPLSRLIDMRTGVPVGAMITESSDVAVELLTRIFNNEMEYDLEQLDGYYRLRERKTQSVVRLQTSSKLLRESFWNYYHGLPSSGVWS